MNISICTNLKYILIFDDTTQKELEEFAKKLNWNLLEWNIVDKNHNRINWYFSAN